MTLYFSGFYPSETAEGAKGSAAFLASTNIAIIQLYKRSATTLGNGDKPNGVVTYTFATANTDLSLVTNGWTTTIPSGSDPLYVVAATAASSSATDTIAANEWATPVILVQNGTQGLSTATIFLFKRGNTSTPPAVPSQPATYTFATGVLLGTSSAGNTVSPFLDGWSQTAPDSAGNKYLFVTTATAISTGANDTITTSEWATVRVLAQDGAVGYTGYLTNESHTLPADTAGNVSTYSGATGQFKVFLDGVGDISSNFALSTLANPQTLTIAYSTNTYTVSNGFDIGEETASVTIRATGSGTYSGVILDKVFSLSKAKAGSNGTSAKIISVTSDRQLISFNSAGALAPTTQTTTLLVNKQNTSATVNWTITDTLGTVLTPSTYLSATTGDSITLTAANFQAATAVNASEGVIITATATDGTTMVDKVTIMKVKAGTNGINGIDGIDGIDGVNGTNAVSGVLTNETFVTTAANDGTGYTLTNSGGTFKIFSGSTDVTTSATFSVSGSATLNGLTIAIVAGTGVYSLSGASWTSDSETFVLQAVYSGVTIQKSYKISKVKNGLSGSSPTTYSVTSSVDAIRKNAAGTLTPTSITFSSTSTTGSSLPAAYAGRYIIATSTDGSTFTDQYTSSANESSRAYTVPAGALYVRARLYLAGGTATQLDQQTVAIVSDGANGIDGVDGVDGVDGTNGVQAVSVYLTSEATSLFAYADGTVVSFSTANGLFKLMSGTTDVTSLADNFSATGSGCTGTINTANNTPVNGQLKGYYQVTAMTSDTATLTLAARYPATTGNIFTKVFTLTKTKGGYEIVAALPSTNLFQGRTVFLTSDNKLYRYTGSAWTSAVPATDISGTITDAQVAGLAASKVTGQLSDSQIAAVAASKVSGTLTNSQIADIAAGKITGQLVSTQLADSSISIAKFASGIEPVTTVTAVPGTKSTNTIFNSTDGKLYRWNSTAAAYIATVPTTDLSGQISNAQIAAVDAVKVSGTLTDAQLAAISAAKITGQLADTQIASIAATKVSGTLSDTQLAAISAAKITGQIANTQIAAVDASKVSGTLTNAQIADIAAAKITGQITSTQITDGAVSTDKLAANSITAAKIAADTITSNEIAANAITANEIAANAVTAAKIAANTITASQIAANTITSGQIAADTITSNEIAANAITANEIAANAVTAAKIAADTITANEIAANAITANEIAANAVTAAKIAANTITASQIAADTITSNEIAANAITANEIAANAVTAAKIAADTITSNQIAADAITVNELAANAVTAAKIAANTITAAQIAANTITSSQIAANTITAGQIAANTITSSQIASDTITAGNIAAGAVTTSELSAGAVTAEKITVTSRGDSVILNPGFEEAAAADSTLPARWTRNRVWGGTTTTAFRDTAEVLSGSTSLALIPGAGNSADCIADLVPVSAGEQWYLACRAKSSGTNAGTSPGFYFRVRGGATSSTIGTELYIGVENTNVPTSWTKYEGIVTIPTGMSWAAPILLNYLTNTGAKVSVDDVEFRKVVTSASIADGAITANKVAANSITAAKIAADTITANEIAANAITATEIAAGAVTAGKIAADSITSNEIAANAITAAEIAAGAVTAGKIAAGSIQAGDIAAGAITAGKIAANAVTATEIASDAVTANKIQAGAVTAAKISVSQLSALNANIGDITAGTIRNGANTFRVDVTNGRTITQTGAFMKVTGAPFGSSNQFIEWYGPYSTNLATCTQANAIYYLTTGGSAYFGGTLSAGILKNSFQTTSISPTAFVDLGQYGSNGGVITINLSYYMTSWFTYIYSADQGGLNNYESAVAAWGPTTGDNFTDSGSQSVSGSVIVSLKRGINGGALSQVSTLNLSSGTETLEGIRPTPGDAPGYITFTRTFGGSMTYTDPATIAQNRQYRADLVTRTNVTMGSNEVQTISLISTE